MALMYYQVMPEDDRKKVDAAVVRLSTIAQEAYRQMDEIVAQEPQEVLQMLIRARVLALGLDMLPPSTSDKAVQG